jgi:4-amino-4-deoxy-L-arabinose transferase-like glycosyltransferase
MESRTQSIRQFALLFFVTGLLLLSGLDKIEINIMEARNFISAREMVQNKEYLLTTLNNEPRYQKPPLPTWITAASGSAFGFDSLFALRLPVVAITFLLVFAFYYFSGKLGLDSKHKLYNGLILITSFYVFFAGRDNQWDMYTHSFMMVSLFFLWKLFNEDSGQFRNSLLSGVFLGCSILSKGPVSFYAMFLPFVISYGIIYKISFRKKWPYLLNMLLSGLVIGASWYIYVRMKDPASFNSIASKETSNWASYEVKPFYYYWSFFLQSGLWAIPSLIALIYPYLKSRVCNLKAYQFALLWTLLALVLLSAIPEKKVRYLVPVLIPLALTAGFYIEYLMRSFNNTMAKREKKVVYFSFGLIAFIGFAYPFALFFLLKDGIGEYLVLSVITSILMYISAFAIVNGLRRMNFMQVFYSSIAVFAVVVIALVPMSKKFIHNPEYASASQALVLSNQHQVNTYSLSGIVPEILWDFGKPIPMIKRNNDRVVIPDEKQFALLVDVGDSTILRTQFGQCQIEKVYRINMYNKKNKKGRLIQDYYLVSMPEN